MIGLKDDLDNIFYISYMSGYNFSHIISDNILMNQLFILSTSLHLNFPIILKTSNQT